MDLPAKPDLQCVMHLVELLGYTQDSIFYVMISLCFSQIDELY